MLLLVASMLLSARWPYLDVGSWRATRRVFVLRHHKVFGALRMPPSGMHRAIGFCNIGLWLLYHARPMPMQTSLQIVRRGRDTRTSHISASESHLSMRKRHALISSVINLGITDTIYDTTAIYPRAYQRYYVVRLAASAKRIFSVSHASKTP